MGALLLEIRVTVQPTSEWIGLHDPGSIQWMLQDALRGDDTPLNLKSISSSVNRVSSSDSDLLPEDKFHIKLPAGVDQYTGQKLDDGDDGMFPEDMFHKKDAHSQYLINQREQATKEKWDKHEK